MRIQPRWWIGVAVFLAYAGWVMSAWTYLDIDYASLATQSNLMWAVIMPLGIAANALSVFNTLAGWWPQTLREPQLRKPKFLAVLLLLIAGFICLNFYATDWAAIGLAHTLVLAGAMLLVGFCEEMVTRGVLLVSLRGSLRSEAWVWFYSTLLFGLLHATNAFFGLGAAALLQVVLAFCAGTGLYLVRRFTGSLVVAMCIHAIWDFSSLAHGLAHTTDTANTTASIGALVFVVGIYGASLILAYRVLRRERQSV